MFMPRYQVIDVVHVWGGHTHHTGLTPVHLVCLCHLGKDGWILNIHQNLQSGHVQEKARVGFVFSFIVLVSKICSEEHGLFIFFKSKRCIFLFFKRALPTTSQLQPSRLLLKVGQRFK